MGFIAIVGSGALGGAVAHALAMRDRVTEVRLIDTAGSIARGKALDIQQSAPIDNFSTKLTAADSIESAVGADVIVLADSAAGSVEHAGEAGLSLLRQVLRAGSHSPILFAGASQRDLIGKCVTELHVPRRLVLGSAPFALESALAGAGRTRARSTQVSRSRCGSSACRRARRSWRGRKRRPPGSRWRRRWRRMRLPDSRRGFLVCGHQDRTPSLQPPRASSRRSRMERDGGFHVSWRLRPGRFERRSDRCPSSSARKASSVCSSPHSLRTSAQHSRMRSRERLKSELRTYFHDRSVLSV